MRSRYSAFFHLNAEKVLVYRAVLDVFREERERFTIALRPAEVLGALAEHRDWVATTVEEVTAVLDQLVDWGNLVASRDTADVQTVQDFYRQRRIYQFSPEGEAAEQALVAFERFAGKPGELQTTALRDIVRLLRSLSAELEREPLDEAKAHEVLRNLTDRFEQLASRAQSFLRGLHAPAELHGFEVARFLEYKDVLIDYLERFIGELVVSTNQIGALLRDLETPRLEAALEAAGRLDTADAFAPSAEAETEAVRHWKMRWTGLRRWFLSASDGRSQAELLRARARAAIPALLATIANLNDRRSRRTDRAADFQALALWFAEAPSDGDLHRLWRAAFGLSSSRHLRTNDETLAAAEARRDGRRTSWLDAAPMSMTPRLRRTGSHARRGPAAAIVDRSDERAVLARHADEERRQIEAAEAVLASGRPLRLGELKGLDGAAFGLFLDLLGEALARKVRAGDSVEATSADGGLHILLEPLPGAGSAALVTAHGTFTGPDHVVTITRSGFDTKANRRELPLPIASSP